MAATRARDYLIFPAVRNGDKIQGACWRRCLAASRADGGATIEARSMRVYDTSLISSEPPAPAQPDPVQPEEVDHWEAAREQWIEDRQALIRQSSRGLPLTLLDELEVTEGDAEEDEDGLELRPSDKEHALERAMRWVLSRVDLDGVNLERLCERIPQRVWPDGETDELASLARRCLESPIIERARAVTEVHRGVEFSAPAPNGGFVEGRVDLLFVENGELVLADFHVDELSAAESRPEPKCPSIAAATACRSRKSPRLRSLRNRTPPDRQH